MVRAVVTKSGNSYALRVPKSYVEENHLKLGDTVNLEDPLTMQKSALEALVMHGREHGPVKAIPNPVEWQRKHRHSNDPWEEISRDSTRQ